MQNYRFIFRILGVLLCLQTTLVFAQEEGSELKKLTQQYKSKKISAKKFWNKLDELETKETSSSLLQEKAKLLYKQKFRVLAAQYAAESIMKAEKPIAKETSDSWQILFFAADRKMIFDQLIQLADFTNDSKVLPKYFQKNWNYYKAMAFLRKSKTEEAFALFNSLTIGDKLFRAARYEKAMLLVETNKVNEAIAELKILTSKEVNEVVPDPDSKEGQYLDLAYLALGRLLYEKKEYLESVRAFRKVNREGEYFYDALWEQAWALFLAGYPNHALGMLHGAKSPYFGDRFNPEISILRSFIFYWMCRYKESRNALADFIEGHAEEVAKLGEFLDRMSLTPMSAYQLFENALTGVSEESLGYSRALLLSASYAPNVMLERQQLGEVVLEQKRLKLRGIFGDRKNEILQNRIDKLMNQGKERVGTAYIEELKSTKELFDDFRRQADFLYLELIMSEKEQLAGKELHKDTKITKVPSKNSLKSWSKGNQTWSSSNKNEFWSDEIGFHILDLKTQCTN